METGKRHIDIDELFRDKLENAGIEPSPAFRSIVMKKTARMEFLRFNPSRFNIWYAGILAAGLITTGIILFSDRGESTGNPGTVPDSENTVTTTPSGISTISRTPARQTRAAARKSGNQEPVILAATTPEPAGSDEEITVVNSADTISASKINQATGSTDFFVNPPVSKTLKEMQPRGEELLFTPSVAAGCAPLKVTFKTHASDYSKFIWVFGDGGQSETREPEYTFINPGEYTVKMIASDESKSPVSHSIKIKVYQAPKADFEISPSKVIIPDEEVRFLNYSRDAVSYHWDFGDGISSGMFEPSHRYVKFGSYNVKLVAVSENGCRDSVTIADAFSGSAYYIEMPNAFIPNPLGPSGGHYSPKSDESAEIFHPSFSGVTSFRMQIFSKRGVLLFETKDISVGWDGYYKGELSNPGVYVWQVSGRFSNGQTFSRKGDVTLLRSNF